MNSCHNPQQESGQDGAGGERGMRTRDTGQGSLRWGAKRPPGLGLRPPQAAHGRMTGLQQRRHRHVRAVQLQLLDAPGARSRTPPEPPPAWCCRRACPAPTQSQRRCTCVRGERRAGSNKVGPREPAQARVRVNMRPSSACSTVATTRCSALC